MTSIYRLLTALLASLTAALAAHAQTVSVGGHNACVDATTHRVLVAIGADESAAQLPATVSIGGTDYEVATTTLPIVRLEHSDDINGEAFTRGLCTIITPDDESPVTYSVDLRYRGATALEYTKKSYAVKLLDADGANLDAPLLGMRNDNSWILDAMACDVSRMRNRVSTDLWLDFARRPRYAEADAPDMVNGTRGRFVEVFLADRYWGLYCLTEKVDRKQLRLKKFKDEQPRGILYKSFLYNNLRQFVDGDQTPDDFSFTWNNFECSYPDVRKGEPITWKPLFDAITFFSQEIPSFDLRDNLHRYADLPLWTDYNLYIDLLHGDDNTCKNMFVYKRDLNDPDEPFSVCPWDLDATWGRSFDHQLLDPTSECQVVNAVNVHLWLSTRDQGQSCINRWAELRAHAFTVDNIWPYFQRYFDLFRTSGAAARETERWQGVDGVHLDFEAEANYIRGWIPRRLAFLDNDDNYRYSDGISTPTVDSSPVFFTLDGRRLPAAPSAPGLYIAGGKKVLIK